LFWWRDEIFPIKGCFPVICHKESKAMDATQATEIRTLLLEAADAIDRANAIVSDLDSDDRALLATPLDEISCALHFELLQKLYLHYPGLAEEGEPWDRAMV
jgi:hypothetical protein